MIRVVRKSDWIKIETDEHSFSEVFNGGLRRLLIQEDLASVESLLVHIRLSDISIDIESNFEAYVKSVFGRNIPVTLSIDEDPEENNPIDVRLSLNMTGIKTVIINCPGYLCISSGTKITNLQVNRNLKNLQIFGGVQTLCVSSGNCIDLLMVQNGGAIERIKKSGEEPAKINSIAIEFVSSCFIGTMEYVHTRSIFLPIEIVTETDLSWFIRDGDYWEFYYDGACIQINDMPILLRKITGKQREQWMHYHEI